MLVSSGGSDAVPVCVCVRVRVCVRACVRVHEGGREGGGLGRQSCYDNRVTNCGLGERGGERISDPPPPSV